MHSCMRYPALDRVERYAIFQEIHCLILAFSYQCVICNVARPVWFFMIYVICHSKVESFDNNKLRLYFLHAISLLGAGICDFPLVLLGDCEASGASVCVKCFILNIQLISIYGLCRLHNIPHLTRYFLVVCERYGYNIYTIFNLLRTTIQWNKRIRWWAFFVLYFQPTFSFHEHEAF